MTKPIHREMPQRRASNCLEQFRNLGALHLKYLKYVGLWTLDSDSSVLLRCLYHVYNKLVITIMFVFIMTLFADICVSFDDIFIISDDGCIFAGIFMVLFKVLIFQIHRERITRLFHATIDNCDQLCKFSTGCEYDILNKYLQFCRASLYGFGILGFFLVIALLFFVSLENEALPIRARYPFNTSAYPWYEIGFFVEACTISVGITGIMGTDSVQMNISVLFLVQFQILCEHFESCGREASSEVSCDEDNYEAHHRAGFAERFGRSVRDHQRLLAIIHDFNEVFSLGTFIQMLSSIMMICLTGFQAVLITGQNSNTYKFSVYLVTAISQLFYICWVGNEVMHQSASLTRSQWLSGWDDELSNAKTGRLLILSMMFSRRTLNLKAGVFYVLSMETFTTILQGSYSFFALLSNMQSEVDQ